MTESGQKIYRAIEQIAATRTEAQKRRAMDFQSVGPGEWTLRLTSGEDGSIYLSARNGKSAPREIIGFDCTRYDDYTDPRPMYRDNDKYDLTFMSKLVSQATWVWVGGIS